MYPQYTTTQVAEGGNRFQETHGRSIAASMIIREIVDTPTEYPVSGLKWQLKIIFMNIGAANELKTYKTVLRYFTHFI